MRKLLLFSLMATVALPLSAHAAVININGGISNSTSNNSLPTWVGSALNTATAIDLHGNQWSLSNELNQNDTTLSGFQLSTPIELTAQGLQATPEVLSWNDNGDVFSETLTQITSITPGGQIGAAGGSLAVDFSGTVSDTAGLFKNDVATFDFQSVDSFAGNNRIGSFNFSDQSNGIPLVISGGGDPNGGAAPTPEAATWLMVGIGLLSVGWMAKRRTNRITASI